MSELTMEQAGFGAALQPTRPALGDPLAAFKERHRKLLREQDAQIRILRDLVEDMRAMNRAALEDLNA